MKTKKVTNPDATQWNCSRRKARPREEKTKVYIAQPKKPTWRQRGRWVLSRKKTIQTLQGACKTDYRQSVIRLKKKVNSGERTTHKKKGQDWGPSYYYNLPQSLFLHLSDRARLIFTTTHTKTHHAHLKFSHTTAPPTTHARDQPPHARGPLPGTHTPYQTNSWKLTGPI